VESSVKLDSLDATWDAVVSVLLLDAMRNQRSRATSSRKHKDDKPIQGRVHCVF